MRLFIFGLLMTSLAFADQSEVIGNKTVETGFYTAVDVETGTIQSSLLLRADNTVNFKVSTPDFTMPEPGCEGTYKVVENLLTADMTCPIDFLSEVQVRIDITNVTPESVRSEQGVNVDVIIDALGEDPYQFNLKKIE